MTKNEQQQQEDKKKYRGADKSLARPGKKQARNHVKDARNFNIIYWPGWPVPEAAITAVRAPNDGCQQPKHVELLTEKKKKKKLSKSHLVGQLWNLIYDARTHGYKTDLVHDNGHDRIILVIFHTAPPPPKWCICHTVARCFLFPVSTNPRPLLSASISLLLSASIPLLFLACLHLKIYDG